MLDINIFDDTGTILYCRNKAHMSEDMVKYLPFVAVSNVRDHILQTKRGFSDLRLYTDRTDFIFKKKSIFYHVVVLNRAENAYSYNFLYWVADTFIERLNSFLRFKYGIEYIKPPSDRVDELLLVLEEFTEQNPWNYISSCGNVPVKIFDGGEELLGTFLSIFSSMNAEPPKKGKHPSIAKTGAFYAFFRGKLVTCTFSPISIISNVCVLLILVQFAEYSDYVYLVDEDDDNFQSKLLLLARKSDVGLCLVSIGIPKSEFDIIWERIILEMQLLIPRNVTLQNLDRHETSIHPGFVYMIHRNQLSGIRVFSQCAHNERRTVIALLHDIIHLSQRSNHRSIRLSRGKFSIFYKKYDLREICSDVHQESNSTASFEWLIDECRRFLQKYNKRDDPISFSHSVINSLSDTSQMQEKLTEIFGYEQMELLSEIMLRRDSLITSSRYPSQKTNRNTLCLSTKSTEYPHVYLDDASLQLKSFSVYDSQMLLPVGTSRHDMTDYEEISMPSSSAPTQSISKLVDISNMEPWVQRIFGNYRSLNTVQSIVYETAFFTNENLLIAAPTGAGKTDIALLAILSIVRNHLALDSINTTPEVIFRDKNFKVIYVAPMKALAAEIVRKFEYRLSSLGIHSAEWTGDVQLSKRELEKAQILVTTPEKYDVISRNISAMTELRMKLLILDEVHLLHDDRGSVLEAIVARTLRQVENSQQMIRIVGLSATLPNYVDVAEFLRVNPFKGLFAFNNSFRPIPLQQTFIGIKGKSNSNILKSRMNSVLLDRLVEVLSEEKQAMVFVHSRRDTVKTSHDLLQLARQSDINLFVASDENRILFEEMKRELNKSRNLELRELVLKGIGIHHAGMVRSDRAFVEKYFSKGIIKVLICTATLAWGVNLPAYAVFIKGTDVFDADKGSFVDLSILDVLQIFGRAGRPGLESMGKATIITTHDKLAYYIGKIASQLPIESKFNMNLTDNLNAEITSTGTVSTIQEAISWLGYTYLYIRMRKNPTAYGLHDWDPAFDPLLVQHRKELCIQSAKELHRNQMIVFSETSEFFSPKEYGRIAAQYYISAETVDVFNSSAHESCSEADVIQLLASSKELDNIRLRDSDFEELKMFQESEFCPCETVFGPDHEIGKRSLLLQAYISRYQFKDFSLIADMNYISQNASRIMRAFFEMSIRRNWSLTSYVTLSICKSIERRVWFFEHPLVQFAVAYENSRIRTTLKPVLTSDIVQKLRQLNDTSASLEELRNMNYRDIGEIFRNLKQAEQIQRCISWIPVVEMECRLQPITSAIIKLDICLRPDFTWNARYHGDSENWWVFVEDSDTFELYNHELVTLNSSLSFTRLNFMVPCSDPPPSQIQIRAVCDRWNTIDCIVYLSMDNYILPHTTSPYTDLLSLRPLSVSVLNDRRMETYFSRKFTHFNPIQTQTFHSLFNRPDINVLLGAPTGSGKTVCAELAILSAFSNSPKAKVVYVALKNNTQLTEILLNLGSDVHETDSDGLTPLHVAAKKGYAEIAKLLLDKGAYVDAVNQFGDTPLHLAATNGHAKLVKLLLDEGVYVNITNMPGWTPLHVASGRGDKKIVELLLKQKGIKTDAKTSEGMTAKQLAIRHGHNEIVNLIEEHEKEHATNLRSRLSRLFRSK